MGQGASYAESAIQQALVRLLTKEAALEQEQLRFCGLDDDSLNALLAVTDATHHSSESHASAQPLASTSASATGALPNSVVTMRKRFGPLVNVAPAYYSVDVLREALPLLPDTLWVSLHRITVLYLLDADGDGRVSRGDVARFTDWAIENVPESVPSEQLAEVLHAQAALHCWHRCVARAAEVDDQSAGTGRMSGRPRQNSIVSATSTASSAPAGPPPRQPGEPPTGSTSTSTSTHTHNNTSSASGHAGASPRPNTTATAWPSSRGARMESAAVHFSRWVLLFVAHQEAARRARRRLAVRRGRLIRRAHAQLSADGDGGGHVSGRGHPAPMLNGGGATLSSLSVSTRASAPVLTSSPTAALGITPSAAPVWSSHTTQEVVQLELDEDAVEAMMRDTPSRCREIEKGELFTTSAVEEIYLDLGVLESSGLSFWSFCRLLDVSSATKVERAIGLTADQAEHEITCAAVLDELRTAVALNHLASHPAASVGRRASTTQPQASPGHVRAQPPPSSTSSSPAAKKTSCRANANQTDLAASHQSMTQSDVGGEVEDTTTTPFGIPDFTVSRYVLQPFIFCFVHAYWNLLNSIGFDPALVGNGRAP